MPLPANSCLQVLQIVSLCHAPRVHPSSVGDSGINLVGNPAPSAHFHQFGHLEVAVTLAGVSSPNRIYPFWKLPLAA